MASFFFFGEGRGGGGQGCSKLCFFGVQGLGGLGGLGFVLRLFRILWALVMTCQYRCLSNK